MDVRDAFEEGVFLIELEAGVREFDVGGGGRVGDGVESVDEFETVIEFGEPLEGGQIEERQLCLLIAHAVIILYTILQ